MTHSTHLPPTGGSPERLKRTQREARAASVLRAAPLNPEGRGQSFRRAAEALERGICPSAGASGAAFLSLAARSRPEAALARPEATAADALEVLLEKAALYDRLAERSQVPLERFDDARAALKADEKRRTLERAAACAAADRRGALKRAREAAAASALDRRERLGWGLASAVPFDARHHGGPVSREAAWKLGLVCWGHTVRHARSAQLASAFLRIADEAAGRSAAARIDSLLKAAGWAWANRRPLVLIPGITPLSMKLACDAWLADREAAVILCGRPHEGNPFERLGIPFLADPSGAAASLLGLDHLPALVERRLGGFAVWAAGGPPALDELARSGPGRPGAVPPWVRTLALIGLLWKRDAASLAALAESGRRLPAAKRFRWYSAFKALADFPVCESREGLSVPQREFLTAVNASALKSLEAVRRTLAMEANRAEADLLASRRRRRAAARAESEAADSQGGAA